LLKSLRFAEFSAREKNIAAAHEYTLDWALCNTDMQDISESEDLKKERTTIYSWLNNAESLLWIHGKPACGKSTLMKYVLRDSRTRDYLHKWAQGRELVVAGFFFYELGTSTLQKSQEGLFASILYEILHPHQKLLPSLFAPLRNSRHGRTEEFTWTLPELKVLFEALLSSSAEDVRICLFIDGLDEYRPRDLSMNCEEQVEWTSPSTTLPRKINEGHREIVQIIKDMAQSSSLKLCVASRPLDVFAAAFTYCKQVKLSNLTRNDIRNYVIHRLKVAASNRMALLMEHLPDSMSTLSWQIVSKADGVFLWVKLVIDRLSYLAECGERFEHLMTELSRLPEELGGKDGLYMRMWLNHSSDKFLGLHLFSLTIHTRDCTEWPYWPHFLHGNEHAPNEHSASSRTMQICPSQASLTQEQKNAQMDMEVRCVRNRSAGLLEVVEGGYPDSHIVYGTTINFIHLTAKEFVQSKLLSTDDAKLLPNPYACLFNLSTYCINPEILTKYGIHFLTGIALQYAKKAEETTGRAQTATLEGLQHVIREYFDIHDEPLDDDGFYTLGVRNDLRLFLAERLLRSGKTLAQSLLPYTLTAIPRCLPLSPKYRDFLAAEPPLVELDTLRLLLEHGADPNGKWHHDRSYPPRSTWQMVFSLIFGLGTIPKYNQRLWCDMVDLLLDYGADINDGVTLRIHKIKQHELDQRLPRMEDPSFEIKYSPLMISFQKARQSTKGEIPALPLLLMRRGACLRLKEIRQYKKYCKSFENQLPNSGTWFLRWLLASIPRTLIKLRAESNSAEPNGQGWAMANNFDIFAREWSIETESRRT
jgi:hypothetical protein